MMNLGERETGRKTERGEERTAANSDPFLQHTIRDLSAGAHSVEGDGDGVKVEAETCEKWLKEMKMSAP